MMVAVEVSIHWHEDLGPYVTSTVTFDYSSLEALAGYLKAELFPSAAGTVAVVQQTLDDIATDDLANHLADELQ